MRNLMRIKPLLCSITMATTTLMMTPTICAGGTVFGNGGALEITQLANHAELIRQVGQQAHMISNQIRQYMAMIQNLRQLPAEWVGHVTMPYREAFDDLAQLKTAVDDLYRSTRETEDVFSRRLGAMKQLRMTPQEYLESEMRLAHVWGGGYKDSFVADVRSIQRTADKAQALRTLHSSIPAISGNVQGLQNLAMQANMMAGELVELRVSIQRQHVLLAQEKYAEQQAAEMQAQRDMRALLELEARRQRDAQFTAVPFKYPQWK